MLTKILTMMILNDFSNIFFSEIFFTNTFQFLRGILIMVNWGATMSFVRQIRKRTTQLTGNGKFTDAQITQSVDTAKQLRDCSPMSDDLDPQALRKICIALKKSDELKTRTLIENAKTVPARGWCIDALKGAVTLICTCGPTVIKEATFNLLGCDN